MDQIIQIAYLLAASSFILGLKFLSSPETAPRGILLSQGGMLIAVVATLLNYGIVNYGLILSGILIGAAIGSVMATKVRMTEMPQMVALLNGFGGLSSALVGGAEYLRAQPNLTPHGTITIALTVLIGMATFTGSLIAFAKLQELMRSAPIRFSFQHGLNLVLLLAAVALFAVLVFAPGRTDAFWTLAALAGVLGLLVVIPIGGGDMPVVISLLNSYSGLAAAASGFVLSNTVLIISGSLVGSAGIILSQLMCKAMNRSLANVLFGGFGQEESAAKPVSGLPEKRGAPEAQPDVQSATPEEAAEIFKKAKSVIIVPGYGMAVAQAQHAVKALAAALQGQGTKVQYAIHPVAGRMPGHMNVLLAEADVPYDQLIDMDEINEDFEKTDVSLVIGANDVVNPAADTDPESPIYGMPILHVERSKKVMVLKRSMNAGFAGIQNALFFKPNTLMVFGDAKTTVEGMVAALK